MPSVSRAQALLLSHPEVWGSYLATNNTDQLLPRLPKVPVVGDSLRVTRVDTLATASFVTSGGTADDSATTYVSTAREFPLRRIPAKVLLNGDIAQNVSNVNDVFEQQIQAKMVAIWNAIGVLPAPVQRVRRLRCRPVRTACTARLTALSASCQARLAMSKDRGLPRL